MWHVGGCNDDTDLMDAAVVAFDDEIETKCTVLTGGTTDRAWNGDGCKSGRRGHVSWPD